MPKSENRMYYNLAVNQEANTADLDIYGDIYGGWWTADSDWSAHKLSRKLEELGDVSLINVNINSYGGEVAEGLAIYNALMRHPAMVRTRVDGFACSIASVIFMAGDERLMSPASLLMVHNAWQYAQGNADELRKAAEDLDTITAASKAAYMQRVAISEEELTALMDAETWILGADAVEIGFATALAQPDGTAAPSQSAREAVMGALASLADGPRPCPAKAEAEQEPEPPQDPEPETEPAEPVNEPEQDAPTAAANLAAFLSTL